MKYQKMNVVQKMEMETQMLNTIAKLIQGAGHQAEEALKDQNSVSLIKENIRQAETDLSVAKKTLASLIIRKRNEEKSLERVQAKLNDLEERAKDVLASGKNDLIDELATAIANLENEAIARGETRNQLESKVERMQHSIETAHSRLTNLKQGAIAAEAVFAERKAQKRIQRSIGSNTSMREAESLVERVMNQSDPFEESQVLDEIDANLNTESLADRLAEAGYGKPNKVSKDDVLKRFKSN